MLCFFLLLLQIKSECLSCRHGVAVFDMSYFGKFYLTGPDAKKAADWLFTADVNKKPGQSVHTHTHIYTPRQMGEKIDRMKRADRWIGRLNKMPKCEQNSPLFHKISNGTNIKGQYTV